MKVAAIQMVSGIDRATNLAHARILLAEAAAAGAELAVLPEYFCIMGARDTDKLALRERPGAGVVQDFLAATARKLGLWIVGGTLPLETGDDAHVFNASLAYAPTGECVARYDKIHLFHFDNGTERHDERRVVTAGDQPVLFELPARDGHRWRIGLSVCYDLRFRSSIARWPASAPICCWCPARSRTPPVRRTGRCCCAPAPSRTWPGSWHPRRAAGTRTAARPGASRWWSIPGAASSPSGRMARAW